jgi:hypothetical protein
VTPASPPSGVGPYSPAVGSQSAPLAGLRFLLAGPGAVVDEAGRLLALLGADVVHVPDMRGPVHGARTAGIDADGAVDATGLLGAPGYPVVSVAPALDPAAAWATAGMAGLTGDPDGPAWTAPGQLVARVLAAGAVVQLLAACRGMALDLDALALLGERAAITGFGRRGQTAVGGSAEIVATADGWVAVNLARAEDVELLPALVDGEATAEDWVGVRAALGRRTGDALVARATLLGLPLARWPGPDGSATPAPFRVDGRTPTARVRAMADRPGAPAGERPLVVDLTSLWAGPLATSLLAATGARVVKVEGARRPDGARLGPAPFFDLLNAGKECIALDFTVDEDRALLTSLLASADLVVEASRPRVMAAIGIDPAEVVRDGRATWISITGYGRDGDDAMRVAFGDDAAFAAGCTVGDPPRFVGDALADPIAGLYAAAVGLAALGGRRGHVVDCSLRDAAAFARGAGGERGAPYEGRLGEPRARVAAGSAPAFGADTAAVRAEFRYGRRP